MLFIFVLATGCKTRQLPEAVYDDVRQKMHHGQLEAALQEADKAYQKYSGKNLEWAWRFRVEKAHILLLRGSLADAQSLLNEAPPDSLANSDVAVRRKMVQALAHDFSQQFEEAQKDLLDAMRIANPSEFDLLGDLQQAQGILDFDTRKYAEASAAFYSALSIARQKKLPFLEVNALGSLGNLAMVQEHFDEAIDWFKKAMQLAKSLGTQSAVSKAFGNTGWSYFELGDFENALVSYKQAVEASKQSGLVSDQAYWLAGVANSYYAQHDYESAQTVLEQALKLARGLDEKSVLTECLNDLAAVALERGDPDLAEQYNKEALQLELAGLDQTGILSSQLVEGRIQANKRRFDRAEYLFQAIVNDPKATTALRWESQARLAKIFDDEGRLEKAEKEYQSAIRTISAARLTVTQDDFRLTFLSSGIEVYADYINFLISHGRVEDALRVAEFSRAQTLEEGLASTARIVSTSVPVIRPPLVAQKAKATLLFYWVGQKQSYLWVISPTKTSYFTLPKVSEIDPLVKSYREALIDSRDMLQGESSEGKKLYSILVDPAKKLIPKDSRVILLPDASLNGLNFETLIVPDPKPHYWIEDVTLTTASSLTLLASATANSLPKEKSMMLIGNTEPPNDDFPALTQAPEEMRKIEKYFPEQNRKILEGKQATPAAYLESSSQKFSYLHFVTHGIASQTRPLESAVILSRDGDAYKLYGRDIVQHPLNAQLVTISACNGAGTRALSGEGLVGLSWAFLRAGAHNVIGALWEVSDSSTPRLMDTMYGELNKGKDPASALRTAKLSLLHTDTVFRKPFYWAPFQLYAGS